MSVNPLQHPQKRYPQGIPDWCHALLDKMALALSTGELKWTPDYQVISSCPPWLVRRLRRIVLGAGRDHFRKIIGQQGGKLEKQETALKTLWESFNRIGARNVELNDEVARLKEEIATLKGGS